MSDESFTEATRFLDERPALRARAGESSTFAALQQKSRSVDIDGQKYYLLEGDLLLDEDELRLYALRRQTLDDAHNVGLATVADRPSGLVAEGSGGKIVRWQPGLVLTYCVLKSTFAPQGQFDAVRDHMQQATSDWEKTCGVQFQHRADLDDSQGTANPGVLFTVRGIDAHGEFIAAAFFPNDPAIRRRVLIDPSFFHPNLSFDRSGVLRHELGHVVGFRHEHIRSGAPPGCPEEDVFGVINLNDYDPKSVMHYFCGGVGSRDLGITGEDRAASQTVYGQPLSEFALFS